MAQDTEWCQNPRCPERKVSTQIRGTKGKKYYQSLKAVDMVMETSVLLIVITSGQRNI